MIHNRVLNQPLIEFEPVPRRASSGGWSPGRQRGFITALAHSGSVAQAAAAVKMSKTGAYALRAARGGEGFAKAWDEAVDAGVQALKSIAFERAVDGVEEPVWHNGKIVGTQRRYNDMLLAALLRQYDDQHAEREARAEAARLRALKPKWTNEEMLAEIKRISKRVAEEDTAYAEKLARDKAAQELRVATEPAPEQPQMLLPDASDRRHVGVRQL
jgi:hypothetical protein